MPEIGMSETFLLFNFKLETFILIFKFDFK